MVKAFVNVWHTETYMSVAVFKPTESNNISTFLRDKAFATADEAEQAAKWVRKAVVGQILSEDNWEIEIDDV